MNHKNFSFSNSNKKFATLKETQDFFFAVINTDYYHLPREISLKLSQERRKVSYRLHLSSQVKFHSFFIQSKREIFFRLSSFSSQRTQLDIVKSFRWFLFACVQQHRRCSDSIFLTFYFSRHFFSLASRQ